MLRYIVQRLIYMLLVLWLISIATFIIIQLPPGDYLSTVIARLESSGGTVSEDVIEGLRLRYGLEDGRVYTLEEVGQTIGVTRERVRQLESQALNRLRQSSARIKLRDYLYEA